jgi:predicted transcriptional regulator
MTKRIHIKLPPIHIEKIVAKHGIEQSSKFLGITGSAIKKYIKDHKAPQPTEMAAQMVFERDVPRGDKKMAIVRGDANLLNMLEIIAKSAHCVYTPIE